MGVSKEKGQERQETSINRYLENWSGIIRGQIYMELVERDLNLFKRVTVEGRCTAGG